MARLQLIQGESPDQILKRLDRAKEAVDEELALSDDSSRQALQREKATILKNRAWAYLVWIEARGTEFDTTPAETDLVGAISLYEGELDERRASPHCLLAQIYELKNQKAFQEWERCLRYESNDPTVEREWQTEARTRLSEEKDE